jgi:hypothetical protein
MAEVVRDDTDDYFGLLAWEAEQVRAADMEGQLPILMSMLDEEMRTIAGRVGLGAAGGGHVAGPRRVATRGVSHAMASCHAAGNPASPASPSLEVASSRAQAPPRPPCD